MDWLPTTVFSCDTKKQERCTDFAFFKNEKPVPPKSDEVSKVNNFDACAIVLQPIRFLM